MLLRTIWMVSVALVASGSLLMAQEDGAGAGDQGNVVDEVPVDSPVAEAPPSEAPAMEATPTEAPPTEAPTTDAAASSPSSVPEAAATAPPPSMGEAGTEGTPAPQDPGTAAAPESAASPLSTNGGGVPPSEHGNGDTSPFVYVLGGLGGVVGLFALLTIYRRKKTWDDISDAMKIDGGDVPMTSQPPSQFNTQDIAGISNTQVSQPISQIKD